MDRNEALGLLRGHEDGVSEWNRWRMTAVDLPDLSMVNLSGTDLNAANLSCADLKGADLSRCLLIGADLSMADLSLADLSMADLSGADLSGAKLTMVDLSMANLSCTNLSNAEVGNTMFSDVDLSKTRGLETIRHIKPSTVGTDTFLRSNGRIHVSFLRGCGLPGDLISHLSTLLVAMRPAQFYSCFISHSSKDRDFAERLHNNLRSKGLNCWYAPKDLRIGEEFRVRIDESILGHDKLLRILSEHSIGSPWVKHEVEAALEQEHEQGRLILFPIQLDDAVNAVKVGWPAAIRRTRHIGDFTGWGDDDRYAKAFERLLRDLKAETLKAAD